MVFGACVNLALFLALSLALAPNTLVQFLSLPHHSTSLHNTLSTSLRFVLLQSNFRQLLTGYLVTGYCLGDQRQLPASAAKMRCVFDMVMQLLCRVVCSF